MWSSRLPFSGKHSWVYSSKSALLALSLLGLAACTVEPLNSSGSSTVSNAGVSSSVATVLASTDVSPVTTRTAQQVRNALLFAMNGGELQAGGNYRVDLFVTSTTTNLSVQTSSLSPTSAQVKVEVRFNVIDLRTGQPVKGSIRRAFASFNRTPQSFANERAERDAQNNAAKEVAQQIRLAVAQIIADL